MPKGGPGCLPCLNVSSFSQKGQQCCGFCGSILAELTVVEETDPLFFFCLALLVGWVHICEFFLLSNTHSPHTEPAAWERHISFTKVTVWYIKHEIEPKDRKYLCTFATQSIICLFLHLSSTVSTFLSSFIVGKTWTGHGYH